ncbi:MAG: hypothetical protein ACK2U9_12545, partial [Anaerolineae bacterium]
FIGKSTSMLLHPDQVEEYLGPYLAGNVVIEALRLAVEDGGQPLGELFLVHGHQGTWDSDTLSGLSAWVVRHIWRPIQRLLRIKTSTPSNDFDLKQQHELAMYRWAASASGRVLVAGHTHHPVWEGLSYQQALERKVRAEGLAPDTDQSWIQTQIGGRIELPGAKPCYFNTGCCSYGDGSMTAIEIDSGEIRLVRWENPDQPARALLFRAELASVLRAVGEP